MELNFFTAANRQYEMFVAGYAFCALSNNPKSTVEIGVEDVSRFKNEQQKSLDAINEIFPDRFLLRNADFSFSAPNIVRFIEEPEQKAELTYIGDIDIFILEDIAPWHRQIMQRLNLPHSNIIRPGTERLTGLHCTKTNEHYPVDRGLLKSIDISLGSSDEKFLYALAASRGTLPPLSHQERPIHGYHISLGRLPFGHEQKGWELDPRYDQKFTKTFGSPEWQAVEPYIDRRFLWAQKMIAACLIARDAFTPIEREKIRVLAPKKEKITRRFMDYFMIRPKD